MLTRIGARPRERNHLIRDGFSTMKELADYFQYASVPEVEKYFKDINKTFGSLPRAQDRVYFTPRLVKLMVAVIWYFVNCVYSFHIMPNIVSVTLNKALELDLVCSRLKPSSSSKETDSKDEDEITLPKLKGSNNWIDFRGL